MNTNRVIFANPIKEQERLNGHEADIPLITNQCLYKGVSAMKNMSIVSLCAESHIT